MKNGSRESGKEAGDGCDKNIVIVLLKDMMVGCPEQPASQAEAAARAVQVPWASGRVRRLDVVNSRVNGHKAILCHIHNGHNMDIKLNIYYLKKRETFIT